MSSFKLQRMANAFPLWTKLRNDPSSLGQRFLEPWAEYFDAAEIEVQMIKDEFNLLKWHLGKSELWSVYLDEEDYTSFDLGAGGALLPQTLTSVVATYPTSGSATLTEDIDFETMMLGAPSRFSENTSRAIDDQTIWLSSSPTTLGTMGYSERLYVVVSNSTVYNKKTAIDDRYFAGYSGVIIKGEDENGIEIEETVRIFDDGVYQTRNAWSRVEEEPIVTGFNGDVLLSFKRPNFPYVSDPYRVGITPEGVEGPLRLRWENRDISAVNYAIVTYFTNRFKLGSEYRRGTVEMDNDEDIGSQILLDSAGSPYTMVDCVVSPENAKLYVLDDSGFVHVYDHGLTPFAPPSSTLVTPTKSTYVTFTPLQPYVVLGDVHPAWSRYVRPRKKVERVQIMRTRPGFPFPQYLNSSLMWQPAVTWLAGDPFAKDPSKSWNDLRFDVDYNILGQWNFYITTQIQDEENTTYHSGVMVDSINALASIDSGVSGGTAIYFAWDGRLAITNATTHQFFTEQRDTYFFDAERQTLYGSASDYSTVTVTV